MAKVVITGLGVVSTIGDNIQTFWESCLNGTTNIQRIPNKWNDYSEYRSGIWSPLPDIDYVSRGFTSVELKQRDPVSLLAMDATQQALLDAGIDVVCLNRKKNQFSLKGGVFDKTGIFIGTGIGGANSFLENHSFHMLHNTKQKLSKNTANEKKILNTLQHPLRVNPFVVSMLMPNSVSASVGIKYSLHGTNQTISQACSSGTSAIGYAYKAIQSGEIDFAICGGAEYLYDEYGGIYRGFDIARTLAQTNGNSFEKVNRPFDEDRSGFLYSQGGSGILILESEARARNRNAPIKAEISGFAETFDAHSMMSLDPEGSDIKSMIRSAVKNAHLQLPDINYINTHGTGTSLNDHVESNVIIELFGQTPLVNASKSILGHTIGASGALEAIISVLSLQNQTTHRCLNLKNPIRDLNFVTSIKQQSIQHVLSESFAFGGHNSALVFSAYS